MAFFTPSALVTLLILLLPLYLYSFYLSYSKQRRSKVFRRRFFHALVEILSTESNPSAQEKRLGLVYKKLSEYFPAVVMHSKGPTAFIENFLYTFETGGAKVLSKHFLVNADNHFREKAEALLDHVVDNFSYTLLPPGHTDLFKTVKEALEENSPDIGKRALGQLAQETEDLFSKLKDQEHRTRSAGRVSFIGLLFTLLFGALSAYQFFLR